MKPDFSCKVKPMKDILFAVTAQEPMESQCRAPRWNTRFGRFVRRYGVSRLASQLGVAPSAIYQWIRGHTVPRPSYARVIVAISRDPSKPPGVSRVRIEDIYAQCDIAGRAFPVESEKVLPTRGRLRG